MDLGELKADYRSIYGGFQSWDQLLIDVQANLYEAFALEALVQELRANGSFRQPVVLGLDEDWGDEEEDLQEPRSTYPAVLDGTKRVLAHMIVGSKDIAVDHRPSFALGEALDRYTMSTKVEIPLPLINVREQVLTIQDEPVDQTSELDLWDGLMSVRINDQAWLSALTGSSQHKDGILHYSLVWDVDALSLPKALINNAMLAQIKAFGFDVSRVKVRTIIEDWAKDAVVEIEQVPLHHLISGFGDPTA